MVSLRAAVETKRRKALLCSTSILVEGFISIEELKELQAGDWIECEYHPNTLGWCECNYIPKRDSNDSYPMLVREFEATSMCERPVYVRDGRLLNGHHRVVAAMDCGFTHVPYTSDHSDSCDRSEYYR